MSCNRRLRWNTHAVTRQQVTENQKVRAEKGELTRGRCEKDHLPGKKLLRDLLEEEREDRSRGKQRQRLRKQNTYGTQGNGPDDGSVFAKRVISCRAGHGRVGTAEVGGEARKRKCRELIQLPAGGRSSWRWRPMVSRSAGEQVQCQGLARGERKGSSWSVRGRDEDRCGRRRPQHLAAQVGGQTELGLQCHPPGD